MEQRWIPVSERLPDADKYILVSIENFIISDIGRYETDKDGSGAFYPGDDGKSYVEYGLFVNAWMPLPEPYRESEDNMERLTYVAENGEVLFHPADLPDDEGITITQLAKDGRYKALEEIAERLANSENFIEPCTVETIFLGNYRDRNGNWCNMAEIHYDRDDCPYVSTEIYFTDIGETVFITETEAEAKLKEMEENHGR